MILDNPDRFWVYILPSTPRCLPSYGGKALTREEFLRYWGKWVIFDDKERFDQTARDLDLAVEMRIIYMVKYTRESTPVFGFNKPLMCVFCDEREREEVKETLFLTGLKPKNWMYERDMFQKWGPGGEFFERWLASQDFGEQEKKILRQDIRRQQEAWLEYLFVQNERFGRLREVAPIWSLEDIHLLPVKQDLARLTPVVTIIGRPNVGKSTLFNRLLGKERAITDALPGTTRDRIHADASWGDHRFTLLDTGGLEVHSDSELESKINEQVKSAMRESDAAIFLLDAQEGITESDREISKMLHTLGRTVILAVNKAEDMHGSYHDKSAFAALGFGDPFFISALYDKGIADLKDELIGRFPPSLPHLNKSGLLKLAIVGRPNVGKSMLLNALMGQERVVVSEVAGTTRDAVDTLLYYKDNQPLLLIDTAGHPPCGARPEGPENQFNLQSRRAMEGADILLFVLDALEVGTARDKVVADLIREMSKRHIIVVNKWDLVKESDRCEDIFKGWIRDGLGIGGDAPILFVSAKYRVGVEEILPTVIDAYAQIIQSEIPVSLSNDELKSFLDAHPPPCIQGKQLKIFFGTQTCTDPPTFVIFVEDRSLFPISYVDTLSEEIKKYFGLQKQSVRIILKGIEA